MDYSEKVTKKEIMSLQTKDALLKSAFAHFSKFGFENTSLSDIASSTGMTRGAVYWHYKNKEDLYQETVYKVLEIVGEAKEPIFQDTETPFAQRVSEIMIISYNFRHYFKFLMQVGTHISQKENFQEIESAIFSAKLKLFVFFQEGIEEIQPQNPRLAQVPAKTVASLLYAYFEGLFVNTSPEEILSEYNLSAISKNISLIID